jgi:hypothetical protein
MVGGELQIRRKEIADAAKMSDTSFVNASSLGIRFCGEMVGLKFDMPR